MASFGDAAMALTGYRVAETQLYLAESTRGHPEFNDDGDLVSSGSMSPWFGRNVAIRLPKKPGLGQWIESELRRGGG